jgi:hypothetical protein
MGRENSRLAHFHVRQKNRFPLPVAADEARCHLHEIENPPEPARSARKLVKAPLPGQRPMWDLAGQASSLTLTQAFKAAAAHHTSFSCAQASRRAVLQLLPPQITRACQFNRPYPHLARHGRRRSRFPEAGRCQHLEMRHQSRAAPGGEAYYGLLVYVMRNNNRGLMAVSDGCRRVLGSQPDPGEAAAHSRRRHSALHNKPDREDGTGLGTQ